MEGLGLVETVAVRCAVHVRVQVLFSLPGSSVPTLTVTFIATRHRVRSSAHFQLGSRLEDLRVVTASPVGSIVDLWADEACTGRRGGVVLGLGVLAGVEHGATTVASASHLHSLVVLGDHRGIETKMKFSKRSNGLAYPVVENPLAALSMMSALKTSRDCSVMRLPRYWLLTPTRGTYPA